MKKFQDQDIQDSKVDDHSNKWYQEYKIEIFKRFKVHQDDIEFVRAKVCTIITSTCTCKMN